VLPETVTDYEFGIKSSMLDRRLQIDGAVFHYNYSNIQANVFNLGSNFVSFINAAKARINGLDLDVKAAPINNLVLHAGLSLLDAKYTSFPGAPFYAPSPGGGLTEFDSTTADGRNLADGKDMIDAPKRQVLFGGTYTIPLGEAHIELAANYSYQSSFFWDFQNIFPEPARHLLSSSVSFAPNDNYEIRFWGRNLLNHQYADQGQTSGFGLYQSPAPPRTYGVTLTARF
jgi:iron complex outermembrane receptor protein